MMTLVHSLAMQSQSVRADITRSPRAFSTARPSTTRRAVNPCLSKRADLVVPHAIKAVIFDMDGVLTDSEGLSRLAAACVFKQLHQLAVLPEEFIPFGGMGEDRFLGGIAEKYRVQGYDAQAAKQLFFETYISKLTDSTLNIAYPGAVELVRCCKAAGIKTAVGSSAEQVKVDANLAAAGFDTTDFDAIVAADKFEAIKPAPDIFLAAARLVGVHPSDCVVVEDAPAGIQAAKNAGMRVIGVNTTICETEMRQHNPDMIRADIGKIRLTDLQRVMDLV